MKLLCCQPQLSFPHYSRTSRYSITQAAAASAHAGTAIRPIRLFVDPHSLGPARRLSGGLDRWLDRSADDEALVKTDNRTNRYSITRAAAPPASLVLHTDT